MAHILVIATFTLGIHTYNNHSINRLFHDNTLNSSVTVTAPLTDNRGNFATVHSRGFKSHPFQ